MKSVTEQEHQEMVSRLVKPGAVILESLNSSKVNLLHAAVGVCTEAGELLDAIKKNCVYEKELDRENVIEELGDLEFYMEQMRQAIMANRDEVLQANIDKLHKKRYPNGYTNEAAIDRADKTGC